MHSKKKHIKCQTKEKNKNTRRLVYGTGALKAISNQLRKEMPGLRGFSATNLKKMRLFYDNWQILDTNSSIATKKINSATTIDDTYKSSVATDESQKAFDQIDIYNTIAIPNIADFPIEDFFTVPFSHHEEIFHSVKENAARYYYIHRTAEEHLSVEALKKIINQHAYENQDKPPNNFTKTIPNSSIARKAVMMFKDSYALQFINTEELGERNEQDIDERIVEQQIIHNVKNFIMTFGNDFAFVGNQYHLEVYGVEQFPDLLFFNRGLNALVVIELKASEFKPSYLGQLMTYLRILDDHVKKQHENPSIGIVLCKKAKKEFVEYVIQDYNRPMGVATYTTVEDMPEHLRKALPDIEQLKDLLSK